LVGGTVGRTATIIRFYQRRGLSRSIAVSSGVIYSVAGFIVQIVLGVTALIFAADEFTNSSRATSSSDSNLLLKILLVIVVLGAIGAIAFAIPKVRRVFDSRVRPEMSSAFTNLRVLLDDPARLVRIFGGHALTQVLSALALGAALHAVGGVASMAALLIVCTLASLLGGLAPVPGGMGVMESTYIAGLTLLGVPEDVAIAATLLYRLCTAYLPPIWGWLSLVWLRRHEMV
jgi:glycosyltransferase 2 family protein